jgi:hypothetical protein
MEACVPLVARRLRARAEMIGDPEPTTVRARDDRAGAPAALTAAIAVPPTMSPSEDLGVSRVASAL